MLATKINFSISCQHEKWRSERKALQSHNSSESEGSFVRKRSRLFCFGGVFSLSSQLALIKCNGAEHSACLNGGKARKKYSRAPISFSASARSRSSNILTCDAALHMKAQRETSSLRGASKLPVYYWTFFSKLHKLHAALMPLNF